MKQISPLGMKVVFSPLPTPDVSRKGIDLNGQLNYAQSNLD
jgi:hypothetical protein